MADIFSPEKRSEVMSKIRSKNTKPERIVFRELRRRRIWFQRHYRRVPESPDVAFPRRRVAIFIDGSFWHGYQFEKRKAKLPPGFWVDKISNNIARDRRNRRKLRAMGWTVVRIWEHELGKKSLERSIGRIEAAIQWTKSDDTVYSPGMAKRLNQGIKNKTSHSHKTKKRIAVKHAAKKAALDKQGGRAWKKSPKKK